MSEIKNLFKNTSWMMISHVITGICAFIWSIIIARYLGVNDFGILSFGISFNCLTTVLLDLGLTTYSIRDMSRNTDLISRYVGNLIPLKILLGIFTFILTFIILILMGYKHITIEVTLILVFQIFFMSLGSMIGGAFQALRKLKYTSISAIMYSLVQLIIILIGVYFDLGLIFITCSYVVGYLVQVIYLYIKLRNYEKPKIDFDLSFWKKCLKFSLPFALTTLFFSIYYSIDVVMLSYLVGDVATGLYNSAYKIISVLTNFFLIYQAVVFPLMSKLFDNSDDLMMLSFNKSIKYLLLLLLPLSLGIITYTDQIVVLIYGNTYISASNIMKILIWTVILLFINGAITTLLNASNKEVSVTKIYATASIFNIILNIILISIYSYNGAALATVISEIFILLLMYYVVRKTKYCPNKSILKDIFKIAVASIGMFVILQYINNMWIGLIIGILVYTLIVLALKILDDDDKYIIKEIIH